MEVADVHHVIVIVFIRLLCIQAKCPEKCTCPAKNEPGQQVSCKGLQSLPEVLGVSSLNVSGNSMDSISTSSIATYTQLNILDLSFNQISIIETGAFGKTFFPIIQTLNLSNNHLTSFPRNLSDSLQYARLSWNRIDKWKVTDICDLKHLRHLYLDGNEIDEIIVDDDKTHSAFCSRSLQQLEVLALSSNKITKLDKKVWLYFTNLQYLSLANNFLKILTRDTFKGLKLLRYLDLSGNVIESLAPKALYHFQDLRFLSLSDNHIQEFPQDLPMVEWLDISGNQLTEITENRKNSVYPQEVLMLGRNPLRCDCDMLWVKEFYDTREYQMKYMNVDSDSFIPVCASPPHLRGDSWDVLADEAFGCNAPLDSPTGSEEDDTLVWKLKDLAIKVVEIGDTFVKLEWESLNIGVESTEKFVIVISLHPFGKKKLRRSISVHPQTGRYVVKALTPKTAYVICVSINKEKSVLPLETLTMDNCLEIVTVESVGNDFEWVLFVLRSPTFYLTLATILACTLYTRSR